MKIIWKYVNKKYIYHTKRLYIRWDLPRKVIHPFLVRCLLHGELASKERSLYAGKDVISDINKWNDFCTSNHIFIRSFQEDNALLYFPLFYQLKVR